LLEYLTILREIYYYVLDRDFLCLLLV